MKKKLAIAILSVLTAFSGVAPAQAFPTVKPAGIEVSKDVQTVQYDPRRYRGGWRDDRGWRGDRGWSGRRYYGNRYYGRRYYRDRGPNVGAVIGGLVTGAIIGGALAQPRYAPPPRRYVGGGNAHTNWCYSRYRSYRAYDNTFQPYNGPRQLCYSPY